MIDPDAVRADLDPEIPGPERDALLAVAVRLYRERPAPAPAFRRELRRSLARPPVTRPRRFRLLVASSAGAGWLLLAVAAAGLAGAGPLAP